MRPFVLAVCGLLVSTTAAAQSFFPFPTESQKPPAPAPKATEPASEPDPDKVYTKPEPRVLPEGPVETLKGPVALLAFDGIVNPAMGEFIARSVDRAENEGAQAVLIELDTPGGLVSTTQSIVQAVMESKVPVIVYVTPSGSHAASAGTIITLAAHVAAMAPATRIGAAHPVTGGGKDPEAAGGKHMGRKIENDLAAMVEGIATERHRNAEWAIDAVRDSVSITAKKAAEIGVIDFVAIDRAELFEKVDGLELMVGRRKVKLSTQGAPVVQYELTLREKVVNFLADPGIAVLLGMLGLLGIMVEVYNPGLIAPGVTGVLCVICSLIAAEQLPIDVGAGILVLAGVALIIAELFTPTYGALGTLGVIGLVVGLLLLVDPESPGFAIDPSVRLGWSDVLPLAIGFASSVAALGYFIAKTLSQPPVTGLEALVGEVGTVTKSVGLKAGTVLVQGEIWRASSGQDIPAGADVEILKAEGLLLTVRPVPEQDS